MREHFEKRIINKSIPEPNTGCWLWTGYCSVSGYGKTSFKAHPYLAHRLSYELFYGKFNHNLKVLHKCDTPACVNPQHLSLGTQKENIHDMLKKHGHYNSKKTSCPRGHLFNNENTRIYKKSKVCRICDNLRRGRGNND